MVTVIVLVEFLNAVRSTLDSLDEAIYSSKESIACENSGLIETSVCDLSSVPYLCLTSPGKSE